MSKHFIIMNVGPGSLLQWSGEYADAMAAIAAFDDAVGIDPDGKGLEAMMDEYDVIEVTAEQRHAVEAWSEAGSPAPEFPL